VTIIDREREACRFLDAFPRHVGAVLVGGYAVNPWAPRTYTHLREDIPTDSN
jgi:hypothetical protein